MDGYLQQQGDFIKSNPLSWIRGQLSRQSLQTSQQGSSRSQNDDGEDSSDRNAQSLVGSKTASKTKQVKISDASPIDRRGKLSATNSFNSDISLGSIGGSNHSSRSVEFEVLVDLHTSWKVVDRSVTSESPSLSQSNSNGQSQSASSYFSFGESLDIYIQDDEFCWIPAKVLEYNADHAIVAINLPYKWEDSTIWGDDLRVGFDIHPSMESMAFEKMDLLAVENQVSSSMLRKVYYKDYELGEMPRQNIDESSNQNTRFSEHKTVSDLADLKELNMATILYNLKERHFIQKPYTRVGDILIAMNPFVWLDDLYSVKKRDIYYQNLIWNNTQKDQIPGLTQSIYNRLGFDPHVYEISSLAYRDLAISNQGQTILVTGESGAGKTETVKILMDHLACAQLSRPALNDDAQSRTTTSSDSKDIIHRIIQSSPVFEAFGNAKTIRNDNSSRFGKFIQLQFAIEPRAVARREGRDVPYTELFGSRVSTYLLEKNRVVFHSEGERTFHIFYQLLAAPSDFKQAMWPFFGDLDANDFLYTAESADETNTEDEHELWSKTKKALETFKVKNVSLTVLMRALGIVLQLGNLVFEHDSSSEYEQSTIISSKDQLERLSEMMGVESHDLQETITSRTLRTPNEEPIKVQLTPEVAKEACDGLAKEIYARIFEAVVQRVNKYTMPNEQNVDNESGTLKQISLLDIFGFENFEVNKFEQLCINYCNEKLQGRYVEDNFHEIKDQYIEEGVDLYDFKLVDNSDILHLLEGTHGLITILNEECFRPKGNDESFVFKAKKRHVGSIGKLIDKNLHTRTEFDINHFAGSVCYDAQNFVLSNTDKLPPDLIACAANSTNVIIRDEFRKLLVSEEDATGPKRRKNTRKTVLSKFQVQLNSLMSAMEGTKIRYIRCIKPNKSMIPKMTDHASAMRQMECSGLLTALTISRESYPQSMEYEFILNRYSCLPDNYEHSEGTGDMELREKVSHMLTKCLKPISRKNRDGSRIMPFACGKTRVFFKAGAQDQLEDLIGQYYDTNARVIQSWCRGSMAARLKIRKKKAIYTIQSFSRMALAILYFRLHRSAATTICNWVRCCFAVALLRKRYEDSILEAQRQVQKRYEDSILEAQRQVQTTYSSKPLSKTDGPHILETNREFVSASGSSSKETLQKLEEQIGELSNINIGLTKEIFKLRHEKNRMRQQHQSTVVQMSSKFSVLKKELESTNRKYQRQKQGSDKVICKGKDKDISREIACLKEKHSLAVMKLKDELYDTRKSHQQYLTRLVDVLETTHNMREEEIAKVSRELISIKKEKDDKIMSLRREIKALKKVNTSKLSSSNGVGTRKDTDDSKHFNDAAADLENFVIQSTTQEHQNNTDAVKQQQKMLDMIRSLKILYQNKS